jgi:hypothetical protein
MTSITCGPWEQRAALPADLDGSLTRAPALDAAAIPLSVSMGEGVAHVAPVGFGSVLCRLGEITGKLDEGVWGEFSEQLRGKIGTAPAKMNVIL